MSVSQASLDEASHVREDPLLHSESIDFSVNKSHPNSILTDTWRGLLAKSLNTMAQPSITVYKHSLPCGKKEFQQFSKRRVPDKELRLGKPEEGGGDLLAPGQVGTYRYPYPVCGGKG